MSRFGFFSALISHMALAPAREITKSTLQDAIHELYAKRQTYIDAMSESNHVDSIQKIIDIIEECTKASV